MEIEFKWNIKTKGNSVFSGNAKVTSFEELETLIVNLKRTVTIIK